MSYKEKQAEKYLQMLESGEGEFDAIFYDLDDGENLETDLVLLSTDEDGEPRFKVIDYEPLHANDRKIVQRLNSETDYRWKPYFSKRGSITGSNYDKMFRPGVSVSEEAYIDQVEQFSSAVFGEESLDEIPEIVEM